MKLFLFKIIRILIEYIIIYTLLSWLTKSWFFKIIVAMVLYYIKEIILKPNNEKNVCFDLE